MAATTWVEEDSLADMKHRLDKLRVDQSRQKMEEQETTKKDTLKILQSKFGSMVYDPTSPTMQAYERRCARSGRRKSIEFEDLYADGGSGRLAHAHRVTSASSRGKHALNRTDNTHNPQPGTAADTKPTRQRKSSDPSSYFRKVDPFYQHHHGPGGNGSGKARGHGVQGHRGIMSVTVSEEDKKMIDEKLSGIGGGDNLGASPPQQRRRKISSPSKIMSKH